MFEIAIMNAIKKYIDHFSLVIVFIYFSLCIVSPLVELNSADLSDHNKILLNGSLGQYFPLVQAAAASTEQIESLQQKLGEAEAKAKESADRLNEASGKLEELEKKLEAAAAEKSKMEQNLKVSCLVAWQCSHYIAKPVLSSHSKDRVTMAFNGRWLLNTNQFAIKITFWITKD